VQFALRPGITDHELLAEAVQYDGTPLSCHMTLKAGPKRISLASPSGTVLEKGQKWSANIAYWGANICRANFIAAGPEDLPADAAGYVMDFVAPYFAALGEWLQGLTLGASAAALYRLIHERLPYDRYHIELNPGHLIHYDEWPSSPFYEGSRAALRSGMVLQSDVIPSHPHFYSTRLEDGYALADGALRKTLAQDYPKLWERVTRRRAVFEDLLGIPLPLEVLPLSNMCGLLAPYGLAPERILAIR
jgi:hypothetical protein